MGTRLVTGLSKGEDSVKVAQEAVNIARGRLGKEKADLAIVYCSTKYDYQKVVETIRNTLKGTLLIGCSTGGEFTEDKVENGSIAVGLIASKDMKFFIAISEGLKEDPSGTMKNLVSQLPSQVEGYPELGGILLIDGLAGRGEEAPAYASNLLGSNIILVGGSAGDDLKFKTTHVFCNDKVVTNAAVLCLIASKNKMFTSVKHGHTPLSKPLSITRAQGSVLYEINKRPAWEVWKEETAKDAAEIGIDVEKLSTSSEIGSFLLRYELGIPEEEGEFKVRVPLVKNDDGSLGFACSIPEGDNFYIMKSVKEKQIDSARKAMEMAVEKAKGAKIAGALVFDCVCRGIIIGDEFYKAVEEFKKVLGNVPILGWETYGEICFAPGSFSGFHNTTSVVLLLPA